MCMFALPVRDVASTNIFASLRPQGPGLLRQTLVYEAHVVTEQPNAMVLPLPVHPGAGAGAIELLDLSPFPDFFAHLLELVEPPLAPGFGGPPGRGAAPLPVHRVGSFDVSIVPTIHDFGRLSGLFRVGLGALAPTLHEQYGDHAFVVYQFAPGSLVLHPFGVSFVTRHAALYFPTLHIHAGTRPAHAAFDHRLFAQRSTLPQIGRRPADSDVWRYRLLEKAPFIDGDQRIEAATLRGVMPNRDTFFQIDPYWLAGLGAASAWAPPPPAPPTPPSMSHGQAPAQGGAPWECSSCRWMLRGPVIVCPMCGRPARAPSTASPAGYHPLPSDTPHDKRSGSLLENETVRLVALTLLAILAIIAAVLVK